MDGHTIAGIVIGLIWVAVAVIFIRVGIKFHGVARDAKANADLQAARLAALTAEDGTIGTVTVAENCSRSTQWPNKPVRKVVVTFCDQYGNPTVHPAGAPFTVLGPASEDHPKQHKAITEERDDG